MSSKQNHRIPTKQTPFTSGGVGGGNNNDATPIRSSSHSHNQRTIMTKTIRKAKRGQVVARKRHLYNFASSGGVGTFGSVGSGIGGIASSSMGGGVSMEDNPYSRDAHNVQRAIQLSRNVVRLCLQQWQEKNNNHQQQLQHQQLQQYEAELATTLDQLCVLLTPDDNDINPSSSVTTRQQQQLQQQQGVSYDSSMAGMAANSILSQFEDSVNDYSNSNSNSNSNNLAVLLATSLGYILSSSYNEHSNTNDDNIVQIKAAIVLNQLAATDPPPPPSSSCAWQHQIQLVESTSTTATAREIPTSWCHVIVNSKDLLLSILHQLSSSPSSSSSASCINLHNNNSSSNNNSIALTEKCISIIGNLLGDSYVAHTALLEMNVVSKLIGCVQFGLGTLNHVTTAAAAAVSATTANTTAMAASSGVTLVGEQMISILQLVRNSVWSLINVIRGGDNNGGGESSTSSSSLMKDIIQGINLEVLLSLPESIQSILNTNSDSNNNNYVECIRTSFDVAIETCWLIVFLTNRNDDTSSTSTTLFGFEIVSGLLKRLCTCTVAAMKRFRQQSTLPGSYSSFHHNTSYYDDDELSQSLSNGSIPCCRALTNIAAYLDYCSTSIDIDTAYEDAMAAREVKDNYIGILLSEMTTRCLVELISLGSIGGGNEAATIACSATVLAGICLVDGLREMNKNHHYQAVLVEFLLPALMEGLIRPLSTYDFKREIVWALWNMFQINQLQNDTRFSLLNEILNNRIEPERVAKSLTGMLTALESSDAVEPCLGLIDMILRERKLPDHTGRSIKVLFEEVGLVDALWYICDNDVDESDVADKAASIIDDFYEEQEEDEVGDVNGMMTVPSVNDGQFQFQAPQPNSDQFFNFTN